MSYTSFMMNLEFNHPFLGPIQIRGTSQECADFIAQFSVEKHRKKELILDQKNQVRKILHQMGKPSKRQKVLEILEILNNQGATHATIEQIVDAFLAKHPGEDSSNLDQVLRDLANKTELVERSGWGQFKLKMAENSQEA